VRLLLLENLGDGTGVIARPGALLSHLLAPLQGLMVKVGQGGEGARREEAPAGVLNGALDAPFFIAPGGAARAGGEVLVGREFEQTGMEMHGVTAALEDEAFQIVIQNASAGPPPSAKAGTWPRRKFSRVCSRKNSSHKARL
jgi:hypothetical protein